MNILGLDTERTYLFDDRKKSKDPICILSREEVKSLKLANQVVHEYQYYNRRMAEIGLNYRDFTETVEKYTEEVTSKEDISDHSDLTEIIFVNVNRTMINLISSLKVFVEHLEKRLKKKYNENSVEYLKFKTVTANLYDGYFSYKLLINLRDHAIHVDFPIDSFTAESERIAGTKKNAIKLLIQFNRDKLLSDEKIERKLGPDLRRYNALFPVSHIMDEVPKLLKILFDAFLKIEKDYFVHHANVLLTYSSKNIHGTKTSFGRINHVSDGVALFDTIVLPIEMIELLRQKLMGKK